MFSADEQKRICGTLTVQNTSGGPLTIESCGNYVMATDMVVDLLDSAAPSEIRMRDYMIAKGCFGWASVGVPPRHAEFEFAQKVESGDLTITVDLKPDTDLLMSKVKT